MKKWALTGCTGFLGLYLLRDLLVEDLPVVVLARDTARASAAERVNAIVRSWEDKLGAMLPRPRCISADIRKDDLGINPADLKLLASCHSFIHCACCGRHPQLPVNGHR